MKADWLQPFIGEQLVCCLPLPLMRMRISMTTVRSKYQIGFANTNGCLPPKTTTTHNKRNKKRTKTVSRLLLSLNKKLQNERKTWIQKFMLFDNNAWTCMPSIAELVPAATGAGSMVYALRPTWLTAVLSVQYYWNENKTDDEGSDFGHGDLQILQRNTMFCLATDCLDLLLWQSIAKQNTADLWSTNDPVPSLSLDHCIIFQWSLYITEESIQSIHLPVDI